MSLKSIFTAATRPEAILVRNLLQEAGIDASLRTDDANGNLPPLDYTEGVDVLVDESEAAEALAVVEDFKRGAAAIDEDQAV
jgi:hypothetical protein